MTVKLLAQLAPALPELPAEWIPTEPVPLYGPIEDRVAPVRVQDWIDHTAVVVLGYDVMSMREHLKPVPDAEERWDARLAHWSARSPASEAEFAPWTEVVQDDVSAFEETVSEHWPEY